MAITQTLPQIPATPGLPSGVPDSLPPVLAGNAKLAKLVAEFARLTEQYRDRAQAHRDIANDGALRAAVEADDLAHAQAVRDGDDDPGPVNVNQWREHEGTARRAVAGSRDALKLVWADVVALLASDEVGGELAAQTAQARDEARARLLDAVEKVRQAMADLDAADWAATAARHARVYAVAQGNNGIREDGQVARWSTSQGGGQVVTINARPEPPENVLAAIAAYRQQDRQG